MEETITYSVGTKDWKATTESLGLVLHDPATIISGLFTWVSASNQEKADDDEPLFGSHLREAATTVKKLLGS
jgi:hypothetical protein